MAKLFQIPPVAGVTKATAKQQMLKSLVCTDAPEQALRYRGKNLIAGVDEVGRGALFGPVVAAAVGRGAVGAGAGHGATARASSARSASDQAGPPDTPAPGARACRRRSAPRAAAP